MASSYWERHPDGPFATLIAVAATYLDPENYDLDSLKQLARRQDDEEMRVFKSELCQALRDPGQLPGDELAEAVEYSDGGDEAFLRRLWHDLYGDEPPGPPRGLLDPDPQFGELSTGELLAVVPRTSQSVLRRGRALLELGRRASSDTALLQQVAAMISDPQNKRLIAVGTASVSQLGTAGLVAGGGEPAATLARELAAEWPTGERSDFAWLRTSSGSAWPPAA
jgi:hypothetical protein